ncbi:hypothetical protein A9Q98_03180 [Thalassotalea sp. 42_200_T64]|nr:hypothetical protein A9Q98_03180 [Thalassotalea sp. 42_200_T64]
MSDSTLNHDKTKALLIHATAASSTKEVADLIGTSSSRISEGKDKRWRLPVESEAILVEAFGPARAEPGNYFEAEVWDSFADFKEQSSEIVAKRQLAKIAGILNDDVKLGEFLDSIRLIDTSIVDKVELRQVKLNAINELIYHPTFINWHTFLKSQSDNTHPYADDFYRVIYVSIDYLLENGLEEGVKYYEAHRGVNFEDAGSLKALFKELRISNIGGLITRDPLGPFASMLYLIGEFSANYQWVSGLFNLPLPAEKFVVGNKLKFIDPVQHKHVVLTGDVIWSDTDKAFTEPMFFNGLDLLPNIIGEGMKVDPYQAIDSSPVYKGIYAGTDRYSGVNVQLNLAKSMTYHMHFQLGVLIGNDFLDASKGRSIVIKDIRADDVFDLINDFADYFKLRYMPMIEIKEMIAKSGGIIPGALYLE